MLNVQKVSSIYKTNSNLRGQKDSFLDLYEKKVSRRLDQTKFAKEFKEILERELKKTKAIN